MRNFGEGMRLVAAPNRPTMQTVRHAPFLLWRSTMKRVLAVAAAFVVAALAVSARSAHAQGADKGKAMPMHMQAPTSHQATITGTVVDVSCKFGQGLGRPGSQDVFGGLFRPRPAARHSWQRRQALHPDVAGDAGRCTECSPQAVRRTESDDLGQGIRGRRSERDSDHAWCLSCQVNERVALASTSTQRAFAEAHVARLRADWTSRDSSITRALQTFGRSGVPLYVLYSADDAAAPVILPALLTPSIVVQAIKAASRPSSR